MDFCRFFEPSANLLSEPDKSVTNTLTLSHSAITILTSVKKESSPPFNTRQSQDDSRRLLGAVFLILPLFGCTQPATGPGQRPLASPSPYNHENIHNRGGGGGM